MARVSRKQKAIVKEPEANAQEVYWAGAYLRLSKEDLFFGSAHKLDNQEQVIRKYVGMHPNIQIRKVYTDNGCTGTNFQRDGFQQMLEDAREKKINCIIVKDLSRLGRNYIETEQYISVVFPFIKVRFIAVNDNFDSLNADGDMVVSLKNIINDAYAKDISRKIYSVKEGQRCRGEFVGNIPPYGYEKSGNDPHKLVVNETTGKVIQKIFTMKEIRMTNTEIAKKLNMDGDISPMAYWYQRGKVHQDKYADCLWSPSTVKVILKNQMYVGDMVQGKKHKCLAEGKRKQTAVAPENYVVVQNTHEPLIDRDLFERVQKICEEEISGNREIRNQYKDIVDPEDLLKDKIVSRDGVKMYRSRNVYENRITYYYMTRKCRNPEGGYYPFFYINEACLMAALRESVFTYIKVLFSIQKYYQSNAYLKRQRKAAEEKKTEIERLKNEIRACVGQSEKLYQSMSEGDISLPEYQKRAAYCRQRKADVLKKMEGLEQTVTNWNDLPLSAAECRKEYRRFLKEKKLTREIVSQLIGEVRVMGKAEITVSFLFEDEVGELCQQMQEKPQISGINDCKVSGEDIS